MGQAQSNRASGGAASIIMPAHTIGKLIDCIRHGQIQEAARLFREETCPGDWDKGWNFGYGRALQKCAEGERPNKLQNPKDSYEDVEIMASLQFRLEMGLLADEIVKNHGLRRPNGEYCLFWNKREWNARSWEQLSARFQEARIADRLRAGGFLILPNKEQGRPFIRPWRYVTTAIMDACLPELEETHLIARITEFMRQYREESGMAALVPEGWAKEGTNVCEVYTSSIANASATNPIR
ncbi:hypothetical protein F5X97DRAFT_172101 [Nemania serpens]|nr:hypothetical protein F5X97DRAFT_172101 [Nemania serpens]